MFRNILIAIPCLNRGGTEMQTLSLVKVLVDAGYKVTTLCYFEYDSTVVFEFRELGSIVDLMNLDRGIQPLLLIRHLSKKFKNLCPDIIHVQYMAPGALPIIAARLSGVKRVLATVHQPWTPSHGIYSKLILRISAILCTRFISVSQKAEESWFGRGQLFNENSLLNQQRHHFTIYNTVEVKKIKSICNEVDVEKSKLKLNISTKGLVFGVISRLRYEKGIDLIIKSFAVLVKDGIESHLLIVGHGVDEGLLKQMVADFKIANQVTFFGEADWEAAMHLMAIMDVVVVPSRFEGFGLTAAEAMAMGKPVIAAGTFGLLEVVTDKVTGLLFKVGDNTDLTQCLEQLASNKILSDKLGINGQLKAVQLFDFSVFSKKIRSLYYYL